MGFRFFKRLNVLPGVQVNLSKSGGSVSVGPQGAKLTLGTSGARVTFGIPGSGLFYTTNFSLRKLGKLFGQSSEPEPSQDTAGSPIPAETPSAPRPSSPQTRPPARPPQEKLTPEFFARLSPTDEQKELAIGCQALAAGDEDTALAHFQRAIHLADGAFLAGCLALKKGRLTEATQSLTTAFTQEQELGRYLSSQGIAATMSLDITEEVAAHVGPDQRGVLLALAEAYQAQGNLAAAVDCLQRLRQLAPHDVVVKLSLAELLMEEPRPSKATCQQVVQLMEDVENETALHTALLLYKAKALRGLGLSEAAQATLTNALKRKKDRSEELLRALRYERALVYDEQGEKKRARMELEKLYAEAPDYEDIKQRLELS